MRVRVTFHNAAAPSHQTNFLFFRSVQAFPVVFCAVVLRLVSECESNLIVVIIAIKQGFPSSSRRCAHTAGTHDCSVKQTCLLAFSVSRGCPASLKIDSCRSPMLSRSAEN